MNKCMRRFERYRLILRHDYVDEGGKNICQIEDPLVMDYMIGKDENFDSPCDGVLLNQLIDWFKHEILRIKGE